MYLTRESSSLLLMITNRWHTTFIEIKDYALCFLKYHYWSKQAPGMTQNPSSKQILTHSIPPISLWSAGFHIFLRLRPQRQINFTWHTLHPSRAYNQFLLLLVIRQGFHWTHSCSSGCGFTLYNTFKSNHSNTHISQASLSNSILYNFS